MTISAGFIRNFECATRETSSFYLIGGMFVFGLIGAVFAHRKSFDRYLSGICLVVGFGIGIVVGAATLALVRNVCAS